jgi:hypothetical protein
MANVPISSYTTYNAIMDGITPVTDIGKVITDAINTASTDVTNDLASIQALAPLVSNPFLGGIG